VEKRRLSVYFEYLGFTWRIWKRVVSLAVTGNTISGREFRRCRVAVSRRHRLPLTASRWDIRWVSCSGKTPTFCLFPVFREHMLVM
jgi:hypothetical protein